MDYIVMAYIAMAFSTCVITAPFLAQHRVMAYVAMADIVMAYNSYVITAPFLAQGGIWPM